MSKSRSTVIERLRFYSIPNMRSTTGLLWNNLSPERSKGACQSRKATAIGPPLPGDIGLVPGSSVVEQLTVNQLVGGSNPSRGAIISTVSEPDTS